MNRLSMVGREVGVLWIFAALTYHSTPTHCLLRPRRRIRSCGNIPRDLISLKACNSNLIHNRSKAVRRMSKKSKQSKQKKKVTTSSSQADTVFDLVGQHILRGHYAEAVANCEHLLNYLPRHATLRIDALAQLGGHMGHTPGLFTKR